MVVADAAVAGGLTTLDNVVIGAFLLGMLAMGAVIARRNRSTEDFFVGGRNLPAWAVGLSLIASLLSTITYLGMPGEMFRTGIGFLTRQLGIPAVLLVVWYVWLPFFMRLRLTSAYEYLEHRFDRSTRQIAAVFCICLLLGWISVVVLTASEAMAEISNLQIDGFLSDNPHDSRMHAMILGVGVFSILYTTMGGMRAVVWTDVVQFLVLMSGAVFTVIAIAWQTASTPLDWLEFSRNYQFEQVEWFSWDVTNRSTVFSISIGMFFWHACTHGANQVALQRYFAVSSIKAARRSFLINALSSIGLGVLLAAVGLALMYFVLNDVFIEDEMIQTQTELLSDQQAVRTPAQNRVFPQFIRLYLPSGLRGLVVAALFAAAMSTIDSGANSIATIVTVDFVERWRSVPLTSREELRLARWMTALLGIVVVTSTIGLYHLSRGTNIIDLCQKGFNCFLGPLGGLFVLGMFSRRVTAACVIPAVLAGEVVGVCASYSQELFAFPFSTHLVIPVAWLTTLQVGYGLSLVLQTRATDEQAAWMWKPVVSGDELTPG